MEATKCAFYTLLVRASVNSIGLFFSPYIKMKQNCFLCLSETAYSPSIRCLRFRRVRQLRLGAPVPRPASDDVLHEHGQSHTHRAAAPQPAALSQEAAAPHHLHRRAAGGSGGPLPGDQVPRRRDPRAAGPQGPSAGGESGGECGSSAALPLLVLGVFVFNKISEFSKITNISKTIANTSQNTTVTDENDSKNFISDCAASE